MEVPLYGGNLNVEKLFDYINTLNKYFDYEDVEHDQKVKYVVTRLRGHTILWWDEFQEDQRRNDKKNIKS